MRAFYLDDVACRSNLTVPPAPRPVCRSRTRAVPHVHDLYKSPDGLCYYNGRRARLQASTTTVRDILDTLLVALRSPNSDVAGADLQRCMGCRWWQSNHRMCIAGIALCV